MIVRAYVRASTNQQNALRSKTQLEAFAASNNVAIANFYIENISSMNTNRPQLQRLLNEAREGDILLCEAIDELSRHDYGEWKQLSNRIDSIGLKIVVADIPLTWGAFKTNGSDPMMSWMQASMTTMMLDVMAAFARKDYERRRHVQQQGIEKAKVAGVYRGKAPNKILHGKISAMLNGSFSIRKIAEILGCSPSTVMSVKKQRAENMLE